MMNYYIINCFELMSQSKKKTNKQTNKQTISNKSIDHLYLGVEKKRDLDFSLTYPLYAI